jgi:hypothetical protein
MIVQVVVFHTLRYEFIGREGQSYGWQLAVCSLQFPVFQLAVPDIRYSSCFFCTVFPFVTSAGKIVRKEDSFYFHSPGIPITFGHHSNFFTSMNQSEESQYINICSDRVGELEELIRVIDEQINDVECNRRCGLQFKSSICALKQLRVAAMERLREVKGITNNEY